MHILLTTGALLLQFLLLVAGFYVAERARLEVVRVRRVREEVGELGDQVESLRKQLASLRGKFYATKAPPELNPELAFHVGRPQPGDAPACDNFVIAQDPAHPGWKQARDCECRFCLEQRHARGVEKAAILAARDRAKPVNGGE